MSVALCRSQGLFGFSRYSPGSLRIGFTVSTTSGGQSGAQLYGTREHSEERSELHEAGERLSGVPSVLSSFLLGFEVSEGGGLGVEGGVLGEGEV